VTTPSNTWHWRFKPNAPLSMNDLPIFVRRRSSVAFLLLFYHICF
jgi:hypothetical protein